MTPKENFAGHWDSENDEFYQQYDDEIYDMIDD